MEDNFMHRNNWQSRVAPRRRALLGAVMINPGAATTADCIIHNFCDHGALLSSDAPLLSDPIIIIIKHGLAVQAQKRWQDRNRAGLRFSHAHNLLADVPAGLEYLKDIFLIEHRRRRNVLTSCGIPVERDSVSGRPIVPLH